MTHTPGPWTWFNYPDGRKLLAAASGAVIHAPDASVSVSAADQALIAAAPIMLAALQEATAMCRAATTWAPDDVQGLRYHALRAAEAGMAALQSVGVPAPPTEGETP